MLIFLLNVFVLCAVQASGSTPSWILNDGNKMPIVALGTFGHIKEPRMFKQATIWALEAGYRHIDTAAFYLNEEDIGEGIAIAIERGIVTREEIFITTKLDFRVSTGAGVVDSLKNSLRKLKLDYLDLYLIHSPLNADDLTKINDPVDIWAGMEEAKRLGLTRSIGVSNFDETLIDLLLTHGKIPPAVNQVEVNPTFTNIDIVTHCQARNIAIQGYTPLGFAVPRRFRPDVIPRPPPNLNHWLLTLIARKYRVSTSQVLLRYLIDRGIAPIVKSFRRERIIRNIDLFKFELSRREILLIDQFNLDKKIYSFNNNTINNLTQYIFNLDFKDVLDLI